MQLDDLLQRYFGSRDLGSVEEGAMAVGIEYMQVDLGMSTDPAQRFALWCLLHMLGSAPDLDAVFDDPGDRDAARNFMDLLATQG